MSILSSIQSIKDNKKLQSAELCSWSYHVILWSLLSNDVLIINFLPSTELNCSIQSLSLSHLYPTLIVYFIYRLPVPTTSIYNYEYYSHRLSLTLTEWTHAAESGSFLPILRLSVVYSDLEIRMMEFPHNINLHKSSHLLFLGHSIGFCDSIPDVTDSIPSWPHSFSVSCLLRCV